MEIYPLDIVIHIINILVLYFLLRMLVYKPVRKFITARSERVQKQLDDAEKLLMNASAEKAEYSLKIEGLNEELRKITKDCEVKAREDAELIVNDAKQQAAVLIEKAREKANNEARNAVQNVQAEIADAAVEIAGRILRREVGIEDNKAVIREFFKDCGE